MLSLYVSNDNRSGILEMTLQMTFVGYKTINRDHIGILKFKHTYTLPLKFMPFDTILELSKPKRERH